jgi:hypothetical protein
MRGVHCPDNHRAQIAPLSQTPLIADLGRCIPLVPNEPAHAIWMANTIPTEQKKGGSCEPPPDRIVEILEVQSRTNRKATA